MGHKTNRRAIAKAITLAIAAALLSLALTTSALAGPPKHARDEAKDISGFDHACGAATDSQGDVYVSSAGEDKIKVYDRDHVLLTSITNTNDPCGLALDTNGNLYVSQRADHKVVKYHPTTYPFAGTPSYDPAVTIDASAAAEGIAVDPFDNRLYVAEGDHIAVYTSAGSFETDLGTGLGEATGVGAYTYKNDSNTRYLFVADAATDEVKVFSAVNLTAPVLRKTIAGPSEGEEFEFGPAGSPVAVDQANGHFMVYDDGHEAVDEFDATGEFLDQFSDPAFEDAEPTGIAVYPQWNELQKVQVSATGGQFKLSFEGGETSPIAHNAQAKVVREALESLPSIDEGDVNVYDGPVGESGPALPAYTIAFVGKLGNRDVAQITATGTLTGGSSSVAASTTKDGSGAGRVYVTSGAGSGARLLAFGPLSEPTRSLLPEPFSRVLPRARAVAVDSYGNVYVSAEFTIHVYDHDGNHLLEFEDKKGAVARRPLAIAVDSEGNLYVIDGDTSDTELTYFQPTSYPPVSGTTYTRHASLLDEGFLDAVGVNPANDHVFLANGNVNQVQEFGSADEGSPGPTPFAPFFHFSNGASGIEVYGALGNVYSGPKAGSNTSLGIIDSTGSETLTLTTGEGCPNGGIKSHPVIDVDQSNGHYVEFVPGQNGGAAREYDAAGTCVAEFGAFSTSGGGVFNIAMDNSCAIHRDEMGNLEPLDETTTPTCAEFDPAFGNVYVAFDGNDSSLQPYDLTAFGPLSYSEPPVATTGVASDFTPGGASLNGTVDPRGFEVETCRFEYLEESEYEDNVDNGHPVFEGATQEACEETAEEIGSGTGPMSVHAGVTGIAPDTTHYRFRLVVENAYGEGQGAAWPFGPPRATTKSALPVLYDEATLRGEVDPSGLATEYHFEYGSGEGEYQQSTAVVELPAGDGPVAVKAALTGLAEGAEYHFRLVAENEAATETGVDQTFVTLEHRPVVSCANAEFRTGLAAFLPECRAYELVTPADTHGSAPSATTTGSSFNNWPVNPRGAGAGESVGFFAATLPGFEGTGETDGYRSKRGAGAHPAAGWMTEIAGASYAQLGGGVGNPYEGMAADQGYWLWNIQPIETLEDTLANGHYLRTLVGEANEDCNDPETATPQAEFELVGCGELGVDPQATPRFLATGGRVVFSSGDHLEDEAAPAGTQSIYARQAGEASAEVLSVDSGGAPFGGSATYVDATEDGAAVVFNVGGTLYLRRAGQTTEIVDTPHTYAGLSADGTRVFYVDTTFVGDPSPADIFVCDTKVAPCAGAGAQAPTEIAEDHDSIFVNVSPDGSHVAFTSEDAVTGAGEENENGEHAEAGEHNLYSWNGTGIEFVGILDDQDFDFFGDPFISGQGDLLSWVKAVSSKRANSPTRSTPDGSVLVFQTHAQLSPYDNTETDEGACGDPDEGPDRCSEIYRFEPGAAPGERLLCISCSPTGAAPDGDALLQILGPLGRTQANTMIPNVTDDGRAVFFQSPDRLLPEDANHAKDVYRWLARGSGEGAEECTQPGGCLALISTGQGERDSVLYGMSADGHDVFFATPEQLVGRDILGSQSIYDARVNGGIPDPPSSAPCQGDACQGQGSPPPSLTSPGTTADVPDGDLAGSEARKPRRCPKGKRKVKRKGKVRCVKPSRKGSKRHHSANRHGRAHR